MCRRFVGPPKKAKVAEKYDATLREIERDPELAAQEAEREEWLQNFNVATRHEIQYVVQEGSRRYIDSHRWGFIHEKYGDVVNARSETVQLKPLFMKAFHDQRCIIPLQGWYEPSVDADGKTSIPQYFWHPDEPVIAVAGIWDYFTDPRTNRRERRVCMVTCDPIKPALSVGHDRSPVLLNPENVSVWLSAASPITVLRPLMVPNDGMGIQVRRVTRRVNYGVNGPDVLGPVDVAKDNEFVAQREAEKKAKADAKKAEKKAAAQAAKASGTETPTAKPKKSARKPKRRSSCAY
jgi:putative SOS response-associated peptidase YedK